MKLKIKRIIRTAGVFLLGVLLCCGCKNEKEQTAADGNEPIPSVEDGSQVSLPQDASNEKYYIVTVSVNPKINFYVSTESNKVLRTDYGNNDAEELVKKGNISFEGKEYNQSIEEFVMACADQNYLNDSNNKIDIIASKSSADAERVPDTYITKIDEILENIDNYVDFDVDVNVPCPYCEATGVCDLCHGEKKIVCDGCHGEKEITCEVCDENGKVVCGLCNGEKRAGAKGICEDCHGNATWQCTECDGVGKLECNSCDGDGVIYCDSCGKTGKQTCNHCNGSGCGLCNNTGLMECTTCHGHITSPCNDCEDNGMKYCNTCRGTGSCICNSCTGTGVYDRTSTCMQCEGTGEENCPQCQGTHRHTCPGCDGTSFMVCVRCDGDGICNQCHGAKELADQAPKIKE